MKRRELVRQLTAAGCVFLRPGGRHDMRMLVLCMSVNAFGSDWAQLEAGTCGRGNLPFRDPLNQERRFIPPAARRRPIKGSLAQFL